MSLLSDAEYRDIERLSALAAEFDVSLPSHELVRRVHTVADLEAQILARTKYPLGDVRQRIAAILGASGADGPEHYKRSETPVFETDLRKIPPGVGDLSFQDLQRIMEIEEEFGVEIPDSIARGLATLEEVCGFLASDVAAGISTDQIWSRTVSALGRASDLGFRGELTPSTPFVRSYLLDDGPQPV